MSQQQQQQQQQIDQKLPMEREDEEEDEQQQQQYNNQEPSTIISSLSFDNEGHHLVFETIESNTAIANTAIENQQQQQQQQQAVSMNHKYSNTNHYYHHTNNNSSSTMNTFFADAILDIQEAHDIADTPEPTRLRFDTSIVQNMLQFGDDVTGIIHTTTSDTNTNINRSTLHHSLQVPTLTIPTNIEIKHMTGSLLDNTHNKLSQQQQQQQQQEKHLYISSTPTKNINENEDEIFDNIALNSTTTTTTIQSAVLVPTINVSDVLKSTNENVVVDNDDDNNNNNNNDSNIARTSNGSTYNIDDYYDIRSIPPPIRPPRWPRDIQWTVCFVLFVPITLLYAISITKNYKYTTTNHHLKPLSYYPLSTSTIYSLVYTCIATIVLCQLLYKSSGGPDGDNTRSFTASLLVLAAPISVVTYLLLSLLLFITCPNARWASLVPLFYTFRDVFLFRRWKRRNTNTTTTIPSNGSASLSTESTHQNVTNSYNSSNTSGGYASRQAFFQALVCMSLDILARSLRRQSFYRVLCVILLLQLVTLLIWRAALLSALGNGSILLLILTFISGKWATGTIARTLTLLASGGVMNWCFHQSASIVQHQQQQQIKSHAQAQAQAQQQNGTRTNGVNHLVNTLNDPEEQLQHQSSSTNGYNNNYSKSNNGNDRVPDAYRTMDASVYQSVLVADDVLDDDFYDDDHQYDTQHRNTSSFTGGGNDTSRYFSTSPQRYNGNNSFDYSNNNNNNNNSNNNTTGAASIINSRSTVKTILSTGLAISFGSIAHCGLLGDVAQFIWSFLRKVEVAQVVVSERRQRRLQRLEQQQRRGGNSIGIINNNNNSRNGFQTMSISDSISSRTTSSSSGSCTERWNVVALVWERVKVILRDFVRDHSDLAMTHVVSYYKAYTKASRDVACLIDESGIEPILHDDITTHICSCISGTITGIIVILTGSVMLHHHTTTDSAHFDDVSIVENMLLSFILCYTLIFTVMEPLRASVKAVYVSFAHCPQSISQTYPLIYHRLCRISSSQQQQQQQQQNE